jgi:hypothetical protein
MQSDDQSIGKTTRRGFLGKATAVSAVSASLASYMEK